MEIEVDVFVEQIVTRAQIFHSVAILFFLYIQLSAEG